MTKKQWTIIGLVVALAGFSLYLNRDWFASENIHIYHRSGARGTFVRKRKGDDSMVNPIVFGFDRKLKLTMVKVVPVYALATNKYALPFWHLISDSNSIAIKDFTYGSSIAGMRPAVKGAQADSLEPGVPYRLFIQTASLKAEHDFVPAPRTP